MAYIQSGVDSPPLSGQETALTLPRALVTTTNPGADASSSMPDVGAWVVGNGSGVLGRHKEDLRVEWDVLRAQLPSEVFAPPNAAERGRRKVLRAARGLVSDCRLLVCLLICLFTRPVLCRAMRWLLSWLPFLGWLWMEPRKRWQVF